jgi:tetratricopeptide (TPR) repeat protein
MGRRLRRLAIVAAPLAVIWVAVAQLQAWRARGDLRRAQQEIARGELEPARLRLGKLATNPGVMGGAVDYWLGVAEALAGNSAAALRAFRRVPAGFPFDARGAVLEAQANLAQGCLHAAERRLEAVRAQGGPDQPAVRQLLGRVYRLQVRFRDVRGLLRVSLAEADNPVAVLKAATDLELDMERIPYDGLREALELAGRRAPDDDRVWLGKARLAIESGQWDTAHEWLLRCRTAGADQPVWRAILECAQGANRPEEAIEAAGHLGPEQLDLAQRLALIAWCHQERGDPDAEARALERWLEVEPTATRALERLAELAHREGRRDRVRELRARKADTERALAAYRNSLWHDVPLSAAGQRTGLGRLAESAGRLHEARALVAWALKSDPSDRAAREALTRVQDAISQRNRVALAEGNLRLSAAPLVSPNSSHRAIAPRGLAFLDMAQAAGLTFVYDNAETPIHQLPEPVGGGVALFDYDGDGWLDVYCVQGGPFAPPSPIKATSSAGDRLFHNRGNGTFEDVTKRSGIAHFPRGHGHGVACGDVDGDGRTDLFVTRWRSYALYRNRGDGTFEDITERWGLGGRRDWPTSAALADLDGDGDLDLYVCHYAVWDLDNPRICRDPTTNAYLNCSPLDAQSLPDHLFRNEGGRFVDVTACSGIIDRDGRGLGVVAADLDDDGRMDLFVANDSSANFLFLNSGNMHFREVAHVAGVAGNAAGTYQAGMGVAAGDLDGDGRIDLAVTNFYGESTTFYRGLGSGMFVDATAHMGLSAATRRLLGFGIALLDADNDGHLDVATANGHVNDLRPNYPYRMPAQLLLGGPDGRLTDVSAAAGKAWTVPRMGRGLAVGDLDNDGREDVLILSHNEPLAYLHNQSHGGHFVTIRLQAKGANRDAIGAKVALKAGGRRRAGFSTGGGSYQSASDPRLHFGLGPAETVQSIEVAWPSGAVSRYCDLAADKGYLLREGADHPSALEAYSGLARNAK